MATLNLERGFRRITAIVSLAILFPGILYALTWWFGERRAWTDALKQPDTESVVVCVADVGEFTFGKQAAETEIRKSIEDHLKLPIVQLEDATSSTRSDAKVSTASKKSISLEEIAARARAGSPPHAKYETGDIPPSPPGYEEVTLPKTWGASTSTLPVSYVYRPTTTDRPGHLYSVKELLEGHHSGTLPEDVKQTIASLGAEKPSRLPWNSWITKPVVFGVFGLAGALGLAAGLAAVPWAVFFLLRWVFRGFAPDTVERP